jgi:hypothetical protein
MRLDIRFWHVYPSSSTAGAGPVIGAGPPFVFDPLQSLLSHAIPALLIRLSYILRDLAAHDAAMPIICVVILRCGQPAQSEGPQGACQASACATAGRATIATASLLGVLRLVRRIVYDVHEALLCFLSDEVEGAWTNSRRNGKACRSG